MAADLDSFFHPRTVVVLGASDTPNKPTSAMTRKIRAWSEQFGAAFFPVNPNREQVDGLPCFASINDVPDDIDLAVILTGNAVQSFEAVVERKPKFAVIFAAGFAEVGAEGEEQQARFADFATYFADQPDVGVVVAYIEGFKDGRSLMKAADHAAQRGVPIVIVKVGRTEAGQSMAKSHTGHLTGSDAVTSAVFRQFGVTRVDGLDELQDTAAMLARSAPPAGDGVCIYAISGGTGAH